jgi:DNA polymerase-3 subunit alpha
MAASLTSEMESTDRIVILMDECRRLGIEVRPPDVNGSRADFTVEDGAIRFGLGAVKNVGRAVIAETVACREDDGPYESLYDLTARVGTGRLNKRVLESLVRAGACDGLGGHRAQLMEAVGDAIAHGGRAHRDRARGQESLFGDEAMAELTPLELPDVEPWDARTQLEHERELLGFYLSGHPLSEIRDEVEAMSTVDTQVIGEAADGSKARMLGLVAGIKTTVDRRGRTMAFVNLEDFFGTVEVLVFADAYEAAGEDLAADQVVLVEGRLSTRENEAPKIIAERVVGLERARAELGGALEIDVAAEELEEAFVGTLEGIFERHPGPGQVVFRIQGSGETLRVLDQRHRVGVTAELITALGEVVGAERVRLRPRPKLAPGRRPNAGRANGGAASGGGGGRGSGAGHLRDGAAEERAARDGGRVTAAGDPPTATSGHGNTARGPGGERVH